MIKSYFCVLANQKQEIPRCASPKISPTCDSTFRGRLLHLTPPVPFLASHKLSSILMSTSARRRLLQKRYRTFCSRLDKMMAQARRGGFWSQETATLSTLSETLWQAASLTGVHWYSTGCDCRCWSCTRSDRWREDRKRILVSTWMISELNISSWWSLLTIMT
jgi:hypothetical protein